MKQFVIIGLGRFGASMAEELVKLNVELILMDADENRIDAWKHRVQACYVVGAEDIASLREIVPEHVDACIIDLDANVEASILITHHLKKIGCAEIMVRAYSESHAEIVSLLGATKVVFPDQEAARRLVPSLVNHGLISYTPVGGGLVFAEIPVAEDLIGLTIRNSGLRDQHQLNVIALRDGNDESFRSISPDTVFVSTMVLLVSGSDQAVEAYSKRLSKAKASRK